MKIAKRILLACLSILSISTISWIILLMNPSISYANKTNFGAITVHHNQPLPEGFENILEKSIDITRQSELFNPDKKIDLCLFDGSNYSKYQDVLKKGLASTLANKVSMKERGDYKNDLISWSWEINEFEERHWQLSRLIAHEFIHAYQYYDENLMALKYPVWKTEGYAEYISRKGMGNLIENIEILLNVDPEKFVGIPWIFLTKKSGAPHSYFKYRAEIQYLIEVEKMTYREILEDDRSEQKIHDLMMHFYKKTNN